MKTFEDFEADAKEFDNIVKPKLMQIYKSFMDYLSKMIQTILKDNENEIISWFKQIKNGDETLIMLASENFRYIRIGIGLSNDKSRIIITLISSYDKFYNPIVEFNSDEYIDEFFKCDYDNFYKIYTPLCYSNAETIVVEFVNQFNNAFYEKFKSKFESVGINDIDSFKKSKYALSFSDKKLSEICNQIYSYYDTFAKIEQDSRHAVEAAKKVFMC